MGENEGQSGLAGIEAQLKKIGMDFGTALNTNLKAKAILAVFHQVENSAMNVARQFGVGRENILNIKAAMTDVVGDVKELGFGFSDIATIQKGIAEDLGRNVILNNQAYKGLLATQKVTGEDAVQTAAAFKEVGVSYLGVEKQMTKAVNVARSLGVSAQGVAKGVVNNLSALNKFNFKNGVEGLAKMVAQSKVLGANMATMLKKAEDLFDPENAIEMAAAMQRLGVTQSELLDPLRLMDMAQNDPGELMNQMGKMSEKFVQLNKDGRFEIMPGAKRQLMEISKSLGMNYEELTRMAIGSKEVEMKMSKIRFPSTFTEEQKQMIANMSEIGPGGEMTMTLNGEQMGIDQAMAKLTEDDNALKKFMKDSEPKTMEELAKEQLTVQESGNILLSSIRDIVGYGLASSKGSELFAKGQLQLNKEMLGVLKSTNEQGETAVLSSKGIRTQVGDKSADIVKSLASGKFSDITSIGGEILGDLKKGLMEKFETAAKIYEKSEVGTIMRGEETTDMEAKFQTTSKGTEVTSSYLDQLQQKVVTESNQNIIYSGTLDVKFSAPPGVNTSDVEKVINDMFKRPEFIQQLSKTLGDPTNKNNPSQTNLSLNNSR